MSTRFSIVHEFDCDVATYWQIFWDDVFNQEQYVRMDCERTVTRLEDEGDRRIRDQQVRPRRELPAIVRKIMPSGSLGYVEHGIWHKPAGPLEVEIKVPSLDRFSMRASYAVTDLGGGRCRREFGGECNVRVPLLGSTVERIIIDNMRETYDIAARVHREWVEKRRAGDKAG
jgi:hypothetical protein